MSRRPRAQQDNILVDHKIALGSGARYANVYPLFHTGGVSEGQQAASDKKRVFILSRSAYAGAQRYGVTAWSGDVLSDWMTFAAADSGGAELLHLRHALLDNGYRRIYLRREPERSEVSRAVCALVPVRRVLADLPRAWNAQSR